MTLISIEAAVAAIRAKHPAEWKPSIAMILGSGLSELVNTIEQPITIAYQDIPGFPESKVDGHQGNLVSGIANGVSVICMQGRAHVYETGNTATITHCIRTLKALGCSQVLATNASGSLREDIHPGDFVLIKDHINFQGINPLVGPNNDAIGPRFPAMNNAYNADMNRIIAQTALEKEIPLHEGVYLSVLGPSYETAAEIQAFRLLGADVIGMSTAPEVIVANHCGLKIAVVAVVTNYATGVATLNHTHETVLATAQYASHQLSDLICHAIANL